MGLGSLAGVLPFRSCAVLFSMSFFVLSVAFSTAESLEAELDPLPAMRFFIPGSERGRLTLLLPGGGRCVRLGSDKIVLRGSEAFILVGACFSLAFFFSVKSLPLLI